MNKMLENGGPNNQKDLEEYAEYRKTAYQIEQFISKREIEEILRRKL